MNRTIHSPHLAAGMAFVLMVCLLAVAGCGGSTGTSEYTPADFTLYTEEAQAILADMTLEEKIGQMIQPDLINMDDINDIRTYHLGSVLFAGDSDPEEGNGVVPWTDAYDRAQEVALESRLGIPLIVGVDAMHGHSNVIGAVIFPHNIGLGCANDPELTEEIGRITAVEMMATGIHWTFAPCVTVVRDDRCGRSYEGFSEEPTIAAELGAALVRGLQTSDLGDPLSVAACAKHYIADGGTEARVVDMSRFGRRRPQEEEDTSHNFGGTARMTRENTRVVLNAGDAVMDEAELRAIHLPPYIDAVNAGVATIMPSYSSWNGVRCHAHEYLLTDVLKNEIGFEGFVISDYSAIAMVDRDYKTAIATCINAGVDMAMIPRRYAEFFTLLNELVEEGTVPMSRIDDAVTRILRVKLAMGLMDGERPVLADRTLHDRFGSPEHREVAREAVRKSLVLLKNDGNTLPFDKNIGRIHLAGVSADDVGNQCGGWTVRWQGASGDVTTGGTSILEAVRATVSAGTEVTYSEDGSGWEGADAALVVVGETPYAEGRGDDGDLELTEEDKAVIETMTQAGIPVAVVLLSGRPMIVTEEIGKSDAFVAAFLPGTEGQGVADVLFGDYAPTGKLSFSWPRTVDQEPINVGDENYDPLYEFGYGLTY